MAVSVQLQATKYKNRTFSKWWFIYQKVMSIKYYDNSNANKIKFMLHSLKGILLKQS